MTKEESLRLLDEVERLFTANSVLRQYVNSIHDMQEMKRKTDPTLHPAPTAAFLTQGRRGTEGLPSIGRLAFASVRKQIEEDADWEQVSKELLAQLALNQEKVN